MEKVNERRLNRRGAWALPLFVALVALLSLPGSPAWSDPGQTDAVRFARLMAATAYRPSPRELRIRYLEAGSPALTAFAAARMGDARALARAITQDRAGYRRAIERCLPAARAMEERVPRLLSDVEKALGLDAGAPRPSVVFLFGAGRSGGTVLDHDVVIALEVVCRFDRGSADPEALLEAFVTHEAVHFHQLRRQRPAARDSLLRQALIEGYADLVTREVLGRTPLVQQARARYGAAHEARLWRAFSADLGGGGLGHWMYGPGRGDAPPDLAYWFGLRISEAYLRVTGDSAESRRVLLDLPDPFEVLARSGYDGASDA